jgi:hypothetical protein
MGRRARIFGAANRIDDTDQERHDPTGEALPGSGQVLTGQQRRPATMMTPIPMSSSISSTRTYRGTEAVAEAVRHAEDLVDHGVEGERATGAGQQQTDQRDPKAAPPLGNVS